MDVLTDLLTRARAQGALFAHSTLRAPWGLGFADDAALSLHAVLAGQVWCQVDGGQPVPAGPGSVLLLTGGAPFRLLSAPGVAAVPLPEVLQAYAVPDRDGVVDLPGPGPATEVLCGAYTFQNALCDRLLGELPQVALVDGTDPTSQAALELLRAEVHGARSGRQVVLDRLLDVLLVSCLRGLWSTDATSRPPSWAGALDDPVVGAALQALHARPAHPWTVAELARTCRVSRAALARRFAAQVGLPPLTYLTRWRMELAREALRRPQSTLAAVAREVGYADPYAFAAAFKREVGTAPGRWRALAG